MKLIDLIKENPDLPIYAWVDSDIIGGDGCRWLGEFGDAKIKDFAKVLPYKNDNYDLVFKDDTDDYLNYLCETKGYTENYAKDIINGLYYEKAIFVCVDLPTDI